MAKSKDTAAKDAAVEAQDTDASAETTTPPAPSAPPEPAEDPRPEILVGRNCFCRPGDMIGQAGILRFKDRLTRTRPKSSNPEEMEEVVVYQGDEQSVLDAGKRILDAATKGGITLKDAPMEVHAWLRALNIMGAIAVRLDDAEMQRQFDKHLSDLAEKKSHLHPKAKAA